MGSNSKIEWTGTRLPDGTWEPGNTFNPWVGCTKVSPGCDHCYAEGWAKRSGLVTWGGDRRRTSAANWRQPIKWNRQAAAAGVRKRVFCASLADVFDNQVPAEWRADLWALIGETPALDWLLLTKRPQNAAKMIVDARRACLGGVDAADEHFQWPWPNVWLGTTVENQAEADRRVPHLLAVPAAVRFLSCEPMLGSIDLMRAGATEVDCVAPGEANIGAFSRGLVDWIIVGGESGPGARPMHPDWARSLRNQCQAAGVPFFFKQAVRDGRMVSLPELDGRKWAEMPA